MILRHTGELPIEVRGPDALRLLEPRLHPRRGQDEGRARCSYQLACYADGGMIIDGVLVRLAEDRFWYGQADGDLLLVAARRTARGMDVEVVDPDVWISQVQGPDSLEVLAAAVDGPYPEPFRYFDAAEVRIAGQQVVITRTGFTNELGWEIYLLAGHRCAGGRRSHARGGPSLSACSRSPWAVRGGSRPGCSMPDRTSTRR